MSEPGFMRLLGFMGLWETAIARIDYDELK